MGTSTPEFVTVRLGKDSRSEIQAIESSGQLGLLSKALEIRVVCKQVSEDTTEGSFAFIWLGSDNNKGQETQWEQGFKAFGQILKLDLKGWNEYSHLTISIRYIFPKAINRIEFFRNAVNDFKYCCSFPIVGLVDYANQTVRVMHEDRDTAQISAFLNCICGSDAGFKDAITTAFPVLKPTFHQAYPAPDDGAKSKEPPTDEALNLIVCGAPGTGKSSWVQRTYETDSYIWKRITFHPEYSYFDFIGSYKPVPVYEKKSDELELLEANGQKLCEHGVPHINYQFVPGPFISLLVEAVLHPDKEHVLIIEEINRADAASVFGDILQVLDRNECGESRYAVDISPELQDFFMLKSTAGVADEIKKKLQLIANTGLKIPKNMRLVATMNGSDQGVQPLDAAFKRRWDFLYMPLEPASAANNHEVLRYSGGDYYWCDFVVALNDRLALDFSVPEDRLIGPYFIKPGQVGDLKAIQKLLLYLRDDIARHNPTFFNSPKRDLASLIKDFTVESADILGIKDKLPASLIVSTEAESSPSQDFTDFWNDFLQYVATREDIPSSYTPYVGNRDRNYLDFHIGPLPCATGITLRSCPKLKKAKVTLYTSPGKVDEFASLLTPHEAEITQAIQSGGQNRVEFKNEPKSGTTLVIETELSEDSNQNFKWFVDTAIKLYNVLIDKLA